MEPSRDVIENKSNLLRGRDLDTLLGVSRTDGGRYHIGSPLPRQAPRAGDTLGGPCGDGVKQGGF